MAGRTRFADESMALRRFSGPARTRPLVVIVAVVAVCLLALGLAMNHWGSSPASSPPSGPAPGPLEVQLAPSSEPPAPPAFNNRTTRSKAGAVAAAAQYATLLAQVFPLDAVQARAVVADAASDDARERLTAAIDANLTPLQEQSTAIEGTTTYRQAVLATHLDRYSADPPARSGSTQQAAAAAGARAHVQVWTLLTVAQTPASGAANASNAVGTFGTVLVSVVWERGAWRLDDTGTLHGPSPLIDGVPSTGSQLNTALRGFTDWRPE
jgi:hypothetical protein